MTTMPEFLPVFVGNGSTYSVSYAELARTKLFRNSDVPGRIQLTGKHILLQMQMARGRILLP